MDSTYVFRDRGLQPATRYFYEAVAMVGVLFIVGAGIRETGAIDYLAKPIFGRPKSLTAALTRLSAERVPYISILTDPTMGGVSASFCFLGDVVIAEPGALVGRVALRSRQLDEDVHRVFRLAVAACAALPWNSALSR